MKDFVGKELHPGDKVVVLCREGYNGKDSLLRTGIIDETIKKVILDNPDKLPFKVPKTKVLNTYGSEDALNVVKI